MTGINSRTAYIMRVGLLELLGLSQGRRKRQQQDYFGLNIVNIDNDRYQVMVHYTAQDRFGLVHNDILNKKFSQLNFFRIWFVLQRCNRFGFKPFMTNMEATIRITGGRNET